jgi:serine/threonine protein kinase
MKIMGAGIDNLTEDGSVIGRKQFIVNEFCPRGSLYDFITQVDLEADVAKALFLQIVKGVHFMHEAKVAHRDIKPDNIFLDAGINCKIGDFGLLKSFNGQELSTAIGTPGYVAPEVQTQNTYEGPPVDIFACGVILFNMVTGTRPFVDHSDEMHKMLLLDPMGYC